MTFSWQQIGFVFYLGLLAVQILGSMGVIIYSGIQKMRIEKQKAEIMDEIDRICITEALEALATLTKQRSDSVKLKPQKTSLNLAVNNGKSKRLAEYDRRVKSITNKGRNYL